MKHFLCAATLGLCSFAFAQMTHVVSNEDLVPRKVSGEAIIAVASSQIGKLDQAPGCPPAGCYLGHGTNWCSEFVSWVYHQAGDSFDGGKSEPWLLNNTVKVIHWFDERKAYVKRDSDQWKTFVPSPGDYVFIGRVDSNGKFTSRAHSGIVESVDADGTLHTIEGNNNGRAVARYIYPNYLTNVTDNGPANGIVLGFGHRAQP